MADNQKYDRIKTAFVATLEDLVKFRGNDPMFARIYAMIVLSPTPLTQEQIASSTGYSRSQISRYLKNLEDRQMVTKESTPGSRTQLYGGTTAPFLESFRRGLETSERFVKAKLEIIEHILKEWQTLPTDVKSDPESLKLKEAVTVFSAWFSSYLDLLSDFNRKFSERLREIEKELLVSQI
ncbi:MAG: GbsR/MarR family transcriptional regulator [Candidatus Thorarchaeota archaeon]|jgi:DNA-binding transcriptional regulator GbsR (MarR family)